MALNQYKHGFCLANFSNLFLILLQAVDDMNGKELNGRQVYVGRAQKKGERQNELKRKFEQMKQDRMTRYQVCWPSDPSQGSFFLKSCSTILVCNPFINSSASVKPCWILVRGKVLLRQ